MKKYICAIVRFEICEDESVCGSDLNRLQGWLEDTLNGAPMDEEVGFPDSVESCADVISLTIEQDRPRA